MHDLEFNTFRFRKDYVVYVNKFFGTLYTIIDEDEICLANTTKELLIDSSCTDYGKKINDFPALVDGEE